MGLIEFLLSPFIEKPPIRISKTKQQCQACGNVFSIELGFCDECGFGG